jgi:hypothetical protein
MQEVPECLQVSKTHHTPASADDMVEQRIEKPVKICQEVPEGLGRDFARIPPCL